MDKIKVGKVVNTHGIKGELKVAYNDVSLFQKGLKIFFVINDAFVTETISSFRVHKNHILLTLDGYSNINDVLKYKNCDLFVERQEGDIFTSDYVGYSVIYENKLIGVVNEIYNNNAHDILVLDNGVMIPFVDEFITDIDNENRKFTVLLIDGMLNEN